MSVSRGGRTNFDCCIYKPQPINTSHSASHHSWCRTDAARSLCPSRKSQLPAVTCHSQVTGHLCDEVNVQIIVSLQHV